METLWWIFFLWLIGLVAYLYGRNRKSKAEKEEEEKGSEVEITYIDEKKEKITDVESYEFGEHDEFLSIYLNGEDPIYIKIDKIKKIQVK